MDPKPGQLKTISVIIASVSMVENCKPRRGICKKGELVQPKPYICTHKNSKNTIFM